MRQKLERDPRYKNANLSATIKPTFQISVGSGTQVIMGQTAKEVKGPWIPKSRQIPSAGGASDTSASPPAASAGDSGQSQQMSGTISMAFDMWVAPDVTDSYVRLIDRCFILGGNVGMQVHSSGPSNDTECYQNDAASQIG